MCYIDGQNNKYSVSSLTVSSHLTTGMPIRLTPHGSWRISFMQVFFPFILKRRASVLNMPKSSAR
jgi:hypothetical protein